jgi:hypothetical protein
VIRRLLFITLFVMGLAVLAGATATPNVRDAFVTRGSVGGGGY